MEKIESNDPPQNEQERNNLPQGGKEDRSTTEQASESRDNNGEGEEQEDGESTEQEEMAEGEHSEQHAEGEEEGGDAVEEAYLLTELFSTEGEEGDESGLGEGLIGELSQQQVVESQGGIALAQFVAGEQERVSAGETEAELQEALVDDIEIDVDLLNSREWKGRGSAIPPELQRGNQSIYMKEEANFQLAMNALKEQRTTGSGLEAGMVERAAAGGAEAGGGSSLLSGMDPLNPSSTERAVQLKGMTVPPQSRQWATELGDRILLMANKKIQTAEIRLNPPNLGLLEVKLAISGDQAHLVFQSGNANVRDVLDSSVHRIREMLEQQGITLVDVNVGQREQQSAESDDGEQGRGGGNGQSDPFGVDQEEAVMSASTMAIDRIGLVDYYI